MTALIGLLGVIAGGLLGGLVSYRVERRNRRDVARACARQISVELRGASLRVLKAGESGLPWSGELRDDQWRQHATQLAGVLTNQKISDQLYAAYLTIDTFNAETTAAREAALASAAEPAHDGNGTSGKNGELSAAVPVHPVHDPNSNLTEDAIVLASASQSLDVWLEQGRSLRIVTRAAAVLAVAAIAVGIGWALVVPRPHMTDENVAAAVERSIPGRQEVQCLDEPGDNWRCTVHALAPSRSACTIRLGHVRPPVFRALAAASSACPETGVARILQASRKGARIIATSDAAVRAENRQVFTSEPLRQSLLWDIVHWIGGSG